MKLATLRIGAAEGLCLRAPGGYLPLELLNRTFGKSWPVDLLELLVSQEFYRLWDWYRECGLEKLKEIDAEWIILYTLLALQFLYSTYIGYKVRQI